MTAPLAQQTVQVKDNAAARKRRRRAPAGGASDDCFTCTKRGVKCDRRRPYCSQCLEVSNECSGYKTQLTWNVGVASRGKLRGLSLPIAKAPPVTREPKKSPGGARARANSAATLATSNNLTRSHSYAHHDRSASMQWPERDEMRMHGAGHPVSRGPIDIPNMSHGPVASAPTTPYGMAGYDYLSMSHPDNTPPMPQSSWGSAGYSPGMVHSPDAHGRFSKFPLSLVTDGLSSSVSSVNSEVDYMSPMSQSYPREEMPFISSPTLIYDNYSTHQSSPVPQSPPSSINLDHSRAPTSYPGLVYTPPEHGNGLSSHHLDVFESQIGHKMMRECDSLNVPGVDAFGSEQHAAGTLWTSAQQQAGQPQQHQMDVEAAASGPLSDPSESSHANPDLVSRMPFFMDYYSNTVCPSMVYIDGPRNPFRENIMQLASSSPSLQHAICALAACNLRMKRHLSLAQESSELSAKLLADKKSAESVPDTQINDPALSEEYQHRNLAVHLLNQKLNDPLRSSHDSVLATILLLCHYRMVESGIARFNTQFAGVKKILAIRKSQGITTEGPSWMEGLFTYFDAISASINDRESQLDSACSGTLFAASTGIPNGIENMVGCDRELFKIISKLGRLNLLSQHRLVNTAASKPDETARADSPFGHVQRGSGGGGDSCSLPAASRFNGNGFSSTLDDDEIAASMSRSTGTYEAHRSAFWKEWKEIRTALQNWQFDASTVASHLPESPDPARLGDLGSLSEAFRYAALLYSERLASPTLPSGHANFQNLVSQVVYYATSLEPDSAAEKFLLWPLFVAGSECVNELQQNLVRTRCREIMARSGYMNNLSALEVLEKLWSTDLKESEARTPATRLNIVGRRSPFNWAKCISSSGPDMEWIMF